MSSDHSHVHGQQMSIPLRRLLLDPENPRLPETHRGGTQEELAIVLEIGFEAFDVAQSIADNGFFAAEPLLAIRAPGDGELFIVVEGNRRLTALLGLADPKIRSAFEGADAWDKLTERAEISLDTEIPIVVHQAREDSHAEVARAHVVGKLRWNPFMQARFIAARVGEGRSVSEVADMIGIAPSKAANLYRDQAVVTQASKLGLNTQQVEKAFSLVTVAMSNTKLRDHVGAPLGSRLKPGEDPIPLERQSELEEVIQWIFGDEDHEALIDDSRQMSQLGNVVASDVGLAAIRGGSTLDVAKQQVKSAGLDPRDRLMKRLTTAKNSLSAAAEDLGDFTDDVQVVELVADVISQAEAISTILEN